jgi:hypothetical protein
VRIQGLAAHLPGDMPPCPAPIRAGEICCALPPRSWSRPVERPVPIVRHLARPKSRIGDHAWSPNVCRRCRDALPPACAASRADNRSDESSFPMSRPIANEMFQGLVSGTP